MLKQVVLWDRLQNKNCSDEYTTFFCTGRVVKNRTGVWSFLHASVNVVKGPRFEEACDKRQHCSGEYFVYAPCTG